MRRSRVGLALAAVVAGLALPGCGGEDEEPAGRPNPGDAPANRAPTRSGAPPSKARFLRQADALCASARRRGAPLAEEARKKVAGEDAIGVAAEVRKGTPIVDELLTEMRALGAPRGDEALVDSYLDTLVQQRRRIPALIEAIEAEDISTIEVLLGELREDSERARRLARSYGFTACVPPALPGG